MENRKPSSSFTTVSTFLFNLEAKLQPVVQTFLTFLFRKGFEKFQGQKREEEPRKERLDGSQVTRLHP